MSVLRKALDKLTSYTAHDRHPSIRPSSDEQSVVQIALQQLSKHPERLDLTAVFQALSLGEKYRLKKVLEPGNFGVVIQAVDPRGKEVVIKISRSRHFNRELGEESLALECVTRIAPQHTVEKVEFHPHLNLPDCGQEKCCSHRAALVTSYGGTDVYTLYLSPNVTLQATHFFSLARTCMDFWNNLSLQKKVLRDIKPENMVLDHHHVLRFIDCGMYGTEGSRADWNTGTVEYKSPAILRDQFDASEVPFALGCVLFEILTGRQLFPLDNAPEILPTDSEEERIRKQVIRMRTHITSVFNIVGKPNYHFTQSLPKDIHDVFFMSIQSRYLVSPAPPHADAQCADYNMMHGLIINALTQSRVHLEGINQEEFQDNFIDLLLQLLRFEKPLTPQEALSHSFFKLKVHKAHTHHDSTCIIL